MQQGHRKLLSKERNDQICTFKKSFLKINSCGAWERAWTIRERGVCEQGQEWLSPSGLAPAMMGTVLSSGSQAKGPQGCVWTGALSSGL